MARSESGAAVQAGVPDVTEEQFQEADADQSGDLSEEEFEALTAGP